MREESHSEVLEKRILRYTWWIFPVLAGLWAVAGSRWLWMWVSLSGEVPVVYELRWFRVMLLMFAGACVPGVWYFGILIGRRWGETIKKYALVPIGVVLFVGLLDAAISMPAVQAPFWLAVRARAGEGDFMMRELAYVKLDRESENSKNTNRIVTVGSSQLLHAVDEDLLQDMCPSKIVVRRALAGTTPLKALGALMFTKPQKGDLIVMYLSQFDFDGQNPMPTDWLRPVISFSGLKEIFACFSSRLKSRYWRKLTDMFMASSLTFWKTRDYAHHLLFHVRSAQDMNAGNLGKPLLQKKKTNDSTIQYAAFKRYAQICNEAGAHLVVFEGQLNPLMGSVKREEAEERVRSWLQKCCNEFGFIYVPVWEQPAFEESSDWKDMTHLSEESAHEFTTCLGRFINEQMTTYYESRTMTP